MAEMHWSFYVFIVCAVAGWSTGAIVHWSTRPPAWLMG